MDSRYLDEAISAQGQNVAEHTLKGAEYTVPSKTSLAKMTVKKLPYVGLAFGLSDVYSGADNAKDILSLQRNPTVSERVVGAAAELANSFSWGLIPKNESARGLSDLLLGTHYSAEDAIQKAKQNVIDAENEKWLQQVLQEVAKNMIGGDK